MQLMLRERCRMKAVVTIREWKRSKVLLASDDRRVIVDLCRPQAMSIQDISRALDLNPGSVHNHIHKLHEAGFLKVESTRKINGIIEKKYRRTGLFYSLFYVAPEDVEARNKTIAKIASKRAHACLEPGPRPQGLFDINAKVSRERLQRISKLADELQKEILDADGSGEIPIASFLVLGKILPRARKKKA